MSWEDSQALLALKVSKESEQAVGSRAERRKVSKTIPFPSDLFGIVSEAVLELQRANGSKIDLQRPSAPRTRCRVVLAGVAGEVDEAEQVFRKLIATSTASGGVHPITSI